MSYLGAQCFCCRFSHPQALAWLQGAVSTSIGILVAFLGLVPLASAQGPNDPPPLLPRESPRAEEPNGPRGAMGFRGGYYEEEGEGRYVVQSLTPGGAAEKAGLRIDDVIVAFNGIGFHFRDDLDRAEHSDGLLPGDRVEVQIIRGAKPITLEITADEMPMADIREVEEFRAGAKYRRQYKTLNQVGRGQGVMITVFHDPESNELTYTAPGFPPTVVQYMQVYVDTMPPLREHLATLDPGERLWLEVTKTGTRLDVRVHDDAPPGVEAP